MHLKTYRLPSGSDEMTVVDEVSIDDAMVSRLQVALCLAAGLRADIDLAAATLAALSLPGMRGLGQKALSQALSEVLSGEPGIDGMEVEVVAGSDPMLMDAVSESAPGLYRFMAGMMSLHSRSSAWWSAGDVLDLCVMFDSLDELLRGFGLDSSPVGEAFDLFRRHFNRARNQSGLCSVRLLEV